MTTHPTTYPQVDIFVIFLIVVTWLQLAAAEATAKTAATTAEIAARDDAAAHTECLERNRGIYD